MNPIRPRYGRLLGDFAVGEIYDHPWEVTIDGGAVALFQASFLDAHPMFSSTEYARLCGLRERPLHPLLCLNLGLSFSVHDVSEQAIAHLAYLDVRFPQAGYVGHTVRARSQVLEVKPSSAGDKGVVHVVTELVTERGECLCVFERKALIRAGRSSAPAGVSGTIKRPAAYANRPTELREGGSAPFTIGQVYLHQIGKTIGESEHMQLTALLRNSHPLHFDELYCKESSFQKTRVVYGGLVFAWSYSLASRDLAQRGVWELGFDAGAHPNPVLAGDTIYAASKVLAVSGSEVTFRLVGVKNLTSDQAFSKYGEALFEPELAKSEKIKEKVFEITRTLLVRS